MFFTTIKSLVSVRSGISTAPTWESFINWWALLIAQGWLPLVILLILFLVFGKNPPGNHKPDKYFFLRLWAVSFIPFILLITHNSEFPIRHWTLPFISILLTMFALSLPYVDFGWVAKIRSWFTRDLTKYAMTIILLISFEVTVGIVPRTVQRVLDEIMTGRKEVSLMYKIVNDYLEQGKKVFANPYTPFNHSVYLGSDLIAPTDLTLKILEKTTLDILVLSRERWYSNFVGDEVDNYFKMDYPKWQEHRKLYTLFFRKSEAIDSFGNKWLKIHEDNYGIEIWEKQ